MDTISQKFTEWNNNGKRGDLREMITNTRGYGHRSINISIKENGKTKKQINYYVHRLIAETLIENSNNLSDVDHIDRDKLNNSASNLRWVSRSENIQWNAKPFRITDKKTGKIYNGENNIQWISENWDWISKKTKMNKISFTKYLNYRKNCCGLILEKFK
jgi:hypothetical protein